MMAYYPHTIQDRDAMLAAVGAADLDALFADIPRRLLNPVLDLPPGRSEMETVQDLASLAQQNRNAADNALFLGAGAYRHYAPAVVDALIQRGEFLTAYTPYQPEVSQGTLQVIFEYQSMICALTGMEVANASHYDGATALAEAVIMAREHHRGSRTKVILSPTIHPHARGVVRTYMQGVGVEIVGDEYPRFADPMALADLADDDTMLVAVQYPNFLGQIDDLGALGLLSPPGDFGADIVCGEGQALGLPLSFGGPYLGYFATRKAHVRKMAGRLVGETHDRLGRRGYVLTLSTREQHIRREKASSNICTNQGLTALAATIYLSTLGRNGLRKAAELCWHKSHYAAKQIDALDGYSVVAPRPFLTEFVVACPRPVAEVNAHLAASDIIGGYDLGNDYAELAGHMLVCVTETNSRSQIDGLVSALGGLR
jgi:glycine dehydrogenase subunit 1